MRNHVLSATGIDVALDALADALELPCRLRQERKNTTGSEPDKSHDAEQSGRLSEPLAAEAGSGPGSLLGSLQSTRRFMHRSMQAAGDRKADEKSCMLRGSKMRFKPQYFLDRAGRLAVG